jgi:hypothetical protein
MHRNFFFITRDVAATIVRTVIVLILLLYFLYSVRVPCLLIELREDSSVKRHTNGIILLNKVIENTLHQTMCS